MEQLNIALPMWVTRLPKKDQPRAKARFLLQQAAILATPMGSISALSSRIGLHRNTLNTMLCSGGMDAGIPVNVMKKIENVIGVGVIPRTIMNPEIYDNA